MFGFGKKKTSALTKLESGQWRCASCDQDHSWPFDLAAFAPDQWSGGGAYEDNSAVRLDGDFLSEDFCVLGGEHFVIRCILPIPVIGLADSFAFGAWCTLSRENFEKYIDGFDHGHYADKGPWTGWLLNRLTGFVSNNDPLGCFVELQPDRQRPKLWVQDETHPLARAQEGGITPDRMMELLSHYGHVPKE